MYYVFTGLTAAHRNLYEVLEIATQSQPWSFLLVVADRTRYNVLAKKPSKHKTIMKCNNAHLSIRNFLIKKLVI